MYASNGKDPLILIACTQQKGVAWLTTNICTKLESDILWFANWQTGAFLMKYLHLF